MHFNTTDMRVLHTLQTATQIAEQNPVLGRLICELDLLLDYKDHFKNAYGEHAIEYKLINATVNFVRLVSISDAQETDELCQWINAEPIRNALKHKVEQALNSPQVLTD